METVSIFRVEHPDENAGPYRVMKDAHRFDTAALPRGDNHPSIIGDTGYDVYSWPFGYVCGCESMKGLRHWFFDRESIKMMGEKGFVINEYRVEREDIKFGKSGTQVAFVNSDDDIVNTFPITRLLTKRSN